MFTSKKLLLLFSLTFSCSIITALAQSPNLGIVANEELIKNWNTSIGTEGEELPPGFGNATNGRSIYNLQCISCHGQGGEGLLNDKLAGGHGSLTTNQAVKTIGSYWPYATTIFDYIRRAMPYLSPKSLSDEEVYSLTAYMLYINNIISEDMIIDANTLPKIEMPNKGNFIISYPNN